jgi:hypothetical protein
MLPVITPPAPQQPKQESPGAQAVRLALAASRVHHTLSMAQRIGIYPA